MAIFLGVASAFLHFMFLKVWGYPLTVAPFAVLYFAFVYYRISARDVQLWAVVFLIVPFISLILALFAGTQPDIAHYFRTYALWSFASLAILVAVRAPLTKPGPWHQFLSIEKIALTCLLILCAFSLAQVVLYAGWGSAALYNPFGVHQYLGQYDVSRFANQYTIRATGLYLEPSFNAFVIISLYVTCLLARYKLRIVSALTLLNLFLIQSMVGLLAFFVMWSLIVFNAQFMDESGRKTALVRLGIVNLILVLIVAASGGISGIINSVNSVNGVSRMHELAKPSTSGYYRLVAPLPVLRDVLVANPLGKPFGQIERTLSTYHLLNGSEVGTTLDNGMYLLVFYFGWLGVAFLAYLVIKMLLASSSPTRTNELIVLCYVLVSLQFSGGVFLPEYVLPLIMILYQFRLRALMPVVAANGNTVQRVRAND